MHSSFNIRIFLTGAALVLTLNGFAQQKPAPKQAAKPLAKPVLKVPAKPAYTPPADTTICIKAFFLPDTIKHLVINKCQDRYNDKDGITSRLCTQFKVSIKVEESRTNGFLIKWRFDKIIPGDGFEKESAFRVAVERLLEGIRFEFTLDSNGAYNKTEYWFSTANQLTSKIDSMKIVFANDSTTKPYMQKLYKIVDNFAIIEPNVTQLAALYFSCYGNYINKKNGTHTSCGFPNIFTGEPFQASGRLRFDSLDLKHRKLVLNWHQGIDTAQARDIIRKGLIKQARINGRPIPEDKNIPHIDIYEDYHLRYNTRTTWFTQITYSKVTTNGKAGEKDTITLSLTK